MVNRRVAPKKSVRRLLQVSNSEMSGINDVYSRKFR
jgi:hypothetical protein